MVPQPSLRPWEGSAAFQVEGATVEPKGMPGQEGSPGRTVWPGMLVG